LKILHVFYDITRLAGYRIRSEYILSNQKSLGLTLSAVFLPVRRANCRETPIGGTLAVPPDIPSGAELLMRLNDAPPIGTVQRTVMRRVFKSFMKKIIDEIGPDIVHAHSAWMSAAQAFSAARDAGLPFVYEVRGLWEETSVAEAESKRGGLRYSYFRMRENHLYQNADAVVTLSKALKSEIISRGCKPERVSIIQNGVDTEHFKPMARDVDLANSLGCRERSIVGYVSRLRKMEGVKYLLEAMKKLDEKVCVVIVGDGPEKPALERLAEQLNVREKTRFVGAVPHDRIKNYYSIIDIFVVPRIKERVCELVTPLKPLEAMAMGKCVLMSDLQGLRETAEADNAAIFFEPENSSALADKINMLLDNVPFRQEIGHNARRYVEEKRNWQSIVRGYIPIYERLSKRK
jgi:glycosyltransferase involved in cell wall biosynthesis